MQFPLSLAEKILDEMLAQLDDVITAVSASLPAWFPDDIADPIFKGMLNFRGRCKITVKK